MMNFLKMIGVIFVVFFTLVFRVELDKQDFQNKPRI